jgi:hypothetical protein
MAEAGGSAEPVTGIPVDLTDEAAVDVAVRERFRNELRVVGIALPCYALGGVLLVADPSRWSARSFALAAGAVCLGVALIGAVLFYRRISERGRRQYLAEYAVLHHLDPGLGRRGPADRRARDMSQLSWLRPLWALLIAAQVGSWDVDVALPEAAGLLLILAALTTLVADGLGQARAGRRWRADPPGPPRD